MNLVVDFYLFSGFKKISMSVTWSYEIFNVLFVIRTKFTKCYKGAPSKSISNTENRLPSGGGWGGGGPRTPHQGFALDPQSGGGVGKVARRGTICDFSADYLWQHSVRIHIILLAGKYFCNWSRQDYFTHFEPSQSEGGQKLEILEKNHQTTRKQNLACLTCDPS